MLATAELILLGRSAPCSRRGPIFCHICRPYLDLLPTQSVATADQRSGRDLQAGRLHAECRIIPLSLGSLDSTGTELFLWNAAQHSTARCVVDICWVSFAQWLLSVYCVITVGDLGVETATGRGTLR
jgi:hypothetical protein